MKSKIDLMDVSFLIPVRIESPDRWDNIQIILDFLTSSFDCHILILESDVKPKLNDMLYPNWEYRFQEDHTPFLWRTKINNQLIKKSKSAISIIYDTDVIFPTSQLVEAVNLIRSGKSRFAYPYNGTFLQVDNYNKKIFQKFLDTDWLLFNRPIFAVDSQFSVGGAFVFSTETYRACGMENEKIQGWGHDDAERNKRIKNLGYQLPRIDGPLFHLWHSRNENSYFFDLDKALRSFEVYFEACNPTNHG